MIKTIGIGLWVCAVTLGAAYFGSMPAEHPAADAAKVNAVELIKLKPITVPIISNGSVEGYLFAVLNYNVDKSKLPATVPNVDPVLQDESFRTLYGVEAGKFKKPRKSDLAEISQMLVEVMNKRIGGEAVKEVLIEELSFIPKDKARAGRGS